MMKVSIIGVKGYPIVYGGYETLVKALVERWKDKDLELTVYCHASLFPEKPTLLNGVKLIYLPAIEKKSLTQLTHSFLSTLHVCFSKTHIVLYVNVANAPLGFLPRLFGKKTIINVDGMEWLRPKWKGIGAIYYKFCVKIVKYFFNAVVTDASEMQRIYENQFDTKSTIITYGAENPIQYSNEILTKYNLTPNEYYLVVGRMIPDNNLDLIIDGYLNALSPKKLVIIGDDIFKGSFASSIHNNIRGNQNIILTGYVRNYDQLCTFYKYCFAYIHGHEYGGTNPTMITALNEGCLILALDTPFTREMLDNGIYGIYFKKNSSDLNVVISSVEQKKFNDNLLEFRKKGKQRVEEKYNWNDIADQYIELFNQTISRENKF